jgi:hypothetical protein
MKNLGYFSDSALSRTEMKKVKGGSCRVNVYTKYGGKWTSEQFTTAGLGEAYYIANGRPFDAECC